MGMNKLLKDLIEALANVKTPDGEGIITQKYLKHLKKSTPVGYMIFITTTEGVFTSMGGLSNYSIILKKILEQMEEEGHVMVLPIPFPLIEEEEEKITNKGVV